MQHLAGSFQGKGLKRHREAFGGRASGEEDRGRIQGWPVGQIKLLPACISHSQVSRSGAAAEYK